MRNLKPWTESSTRWLRELAPHYTAKELAEIFERSVSSVTGKLYIMGVSPKMDLRAWTSSEVLTLKDLKSRGLSSAQIGLAVGRTPAAVRSFIRHHLK